MTNLFDDAQTLGEIFDLLLGACLGDVQTNFIVKSMQVQSHQQFFDGFGTHHCGELAAILFVRVTVFVFGEQLAFFKFGIAWIGDDIVLEVDDLFQIGCLHAKKVTQVTGDGLEEPDMDDRCRQVDVSHAFATHAGVGDFHATSVTDDAFEFGTFVLAAGTFIVTFGAEDAFTEQAVLFGTVGSVVDGFRLLDFTEAPRADVVGACQ